MDIIIKENSNVICGEIIPPSDKSISHRSLILGAVAKGTTKIYNLLESEDVLATMQIVKQLGVKIEKNHNYHIINSLGYRELKQSEEILDAKNSGTTMRLIQGVLAGLSGNHYLIGDKSLNKRPMQRIIKPLSKMGADIKAHKQNYAPLNIRGSKLKAIDYTLEIPSAQVKSAIILAALFAEGTTKLTEPIISRNHTEQMLPCFGGKITKKQDTYLIPGNQQLTGAIVKVPNDFSSASFFIALGLIHHNSKIYIKEVNLNHTRTGLLDVIKKMQGSVEIQKITSEQGNILVKSSQLHGTEIGGELIPRLIDELPIVALLATQAQGKTIIHDAKELRYKETDRIHTVVKNLRKMGANIKELSDGMQIEGPTPLIGTHVDSYYDHRLGMMLSIAGIIAKGQTVISNAESVNISYPTFFEDLAKIQGENK